MFCVVLLLGTLTLGAADYLSSQPEIYSHYGEAAGGYDPNQVQGIFAALWKMLTDKTGYASHIEVGKATGSCEETSVHATYIDGPSIFKAYGLYTSNIKYLSVSQDKKAADGSVKLWVGGLEKPFLILEFKVPAVKKTGAFKIKMCW